MLPSKTLKYIRDMVPAIMKHTYFSKGLYMYVFFAYKYIFTYIYISLPFSCPIT